MIVWHLDIKKIQCLIHYTLFERTKNNAAVHSMTNVWYFRDRIQLFSSLKQNEKSPSSLKKKFQAHAQ